MSVTPKILLLAAAIYCLLLFGCRDTLNVGGDSLHFGPQITAFTVEPAGTAQLQGGGQATFSVNFQNGVAPYTIAIDFGGCTAPNLLPTPATSPFSTTVTLVELDTEQSFTATARLTDYTGITGNPQTLTFNVQPSPNNPPSIDSIEAQGGVVTVAVSDPDAEDVTVTATGFEPELSLGQSSQQVPGGNGEVLFVFSSVEVFAGAIGTASFSATDPHGASDSDSVCEIRISPLATPQGVLGCYPRENCCSVGDSQRISVFTTPIEQPLQFMSGVSVVFMPGSSYVAGSFDHGSAVDSDPLDPQLAGDRESVDGFWALVNPSGGFLSGADPKPDTDLPAPFAGGSAYDFIITPLAGQDAPAGSSGVLFSFVAQFSQPGRYYFDILAFDEINRTYYQDGAANVYNWGGYYNDDIFHSVLVH